MTSFGNFVVLLAIKQLRSIRLPSKLLLCSLTAADLAVGLISYPQRVAFFTLKSRQIFSPAFCLSAKLNVSTITLFAGVSTYTMTAISIDRYAALFFRVKYKQVVTARRVCAVLVFIWALSLFTSSMTFWNYVLLEHTLISGLVVCLLATSLAYIKIYRELRRRPRRIDPRAAAGGERTAAWDSFNEAKYRKTASAMLWVYALSILCSVPMFSIKLVIVNLEHTALLQCIYEAFISFLLLSSCLNPYVYCLRVPGVRARVVRLCRSFCCRQPVSADIDGTQSEYSKTNS